MRAKTPEEANHEAAKLAALAEFHGLTVASFIEEYVLASWVPGICMHPGCEYTDEVKPDEREGWCEHCGHRSVWSALVLAGIV
jgi:hypothetical protein